jgi:uncharacterized protein YkwD
MDGAAAPVDPPAIWAEATSSPVALGEPPADPLEREALSRCGPGDAHLSAAAGEVLSRALRGLPLPDADALAFAQRAAGEPHPWARAWAASARTLSTEATLRKLDEWLSDDRDSQLRRCAVTSGVSPDGTHVLAVVAVEALADLAPLPTRARTGQWLAVAARLRVGASAGEVLVLGPSGAPRHVPAWFDGATLHARFALDRPGAFTVQVLATIASGPRPVVEASVFADAEPPGHASQEPAPGEDGPPVDTLVDTLVNPPVATPLDTPVDRHGGDDDDLSIALSSMLAAARAASGEPPLARDPHLDAIARDHARRMVANHALAHDVGDGDPTARMAAAGIASLSVGENVAHAATVALAHRSLWASPSHRANMLRRAFDRVGLAALRDERGDVWVVESFAATKR